MRLSKQVLLYSTDLHFFFNVALYSNNKSQMQHTTQSSLYGFEILLIMSILFIFFLHNAKDARLILISIQHEKGIFQISSFRIWKTVKMMLFHAFYLQFYARLLSFWDKHNLDLPHILSHSMAKTLSKIKVFLLQTAFKMICRMIKCRMISFGWWKWINYQMPSVLNKS